jgi:hypothetical protein
MRSKSLPVSIVLVLVAALVLVMPVLGCWMEWWISFEASQCLNYVPTTGGQAGEYMLSMMATGDPGLSGTVEITLSLEGASGTLDVGVISPAVVTRTLSTGSSAQAVISLEFAALEWDQVVAEGGSLRATITQDSFGGNVGVAGQIFLTACPTAASDVTLSAVATAEGVTVSVEGFGDMVEIRHEDGDTPLAVVASQGGIISQTVFLPEDLGDVPFVARVHDGLGAPEDTEPIMAEAATVYMSEVTPFTHGLHIDMESVFGSIGQDHILDVHAVMQYPDGAVHVVANFIPGYWNGPRDGREFDIVGLLSGEYKLWLEVNYYNGNTARSLQQVTVVVEDHDPVVVAPPGTNAVRMEGFTARGGVLGSLVEFVFGLFSN